jgi:hypothetical protein
VSDLLSEVRREQAEERREQENPQPKVRAVRKIRSDKGVPRGKYKPRAKKETASE